MNFVESATLRLIDESSGKIRRINSELSKLFATARKGKRIRIDIDGLDKASAQARKLHADMSRLSRPVRLRVDAAGLNKVVNDLARLPRQKTVRINTIASSTGINSPTMWRNVGRDIGFGFRASIGAEVFQFMKRRAGEGFTQTDVADTRLSLQQLTPAAESLANAAVASIIAQQQRLPSGQLLNEAQTRSLMSESLGVTRGDVVAGRMLTDQLIEMIKLGVAQGQTLSEASTYAIDFAKAGEQMGRFSDAAGRFDPKGATQWFDLMRQAGPSIGKEFTGQFVRQATQGLRGAKGAISDREFLKLLFLQEENTSAAVGFNQAIKNLSGERATKKSLKNLEALGLITTEQAKAGEVGGLSLTEVISGGAVDEATMRSDLSKWVNERLIPSIIKVGLDPNNPLDVSRFVGKVSQDRVAQEAITSLINRSRELDAQADYALRRSGSVQAMEDILRESSTLRMQSFGAQIEGLFGNAGRFLEPVLIPAIDSLNKQIADLASGKMSAGGIAAIAGAGAAASFASAPFATLAGVQALTTGTGSDRLLGAIAVNTANTATGVAALAAAQGIDALGGVGKGALGAGLRAMFGPTAAAAAVAYGVTQAFVNTPPNDPSRANAQRNEDALRFKKFRDDMIKQGLEPGSVGGMARVIEEAKNGLGDLASVASQAATSVPAVQPLFDAQGNLVSSFNETASALDSFVRHTVDMQKRADASSTAEEKAKFKEFTALGHNPNDLADLATGKAGAEATRLLQARVGAFVDGVFGPQTLSQYKQYLQDVMQRNARQEFLSDLKDGTTAQSTAGFESPLVPTAANLESVFMTGANDLASAGSQIGADITAAGQTLGAQGTAIGQNATSAFDASTLGSRLGSAAAAAFNSQARAPSPSAGGAPVNTGTTAAPIE